MSETAKLECASPPLPETEDAEVHKPQILSTPAYTMGEVRPVANLGRIFGQFAELQQQIAGQVIALQESVHQQKEDLAALTGQLPELRESMNWLIACFHDQSKKDALIRDRLERHDAAIETLNETLRGMADQTRRWQVVFDEVITILAHDRATRIATKSGFSA